MIYCYQDKRGHCPVKEWLETLNDESVLNKVNVMLEQMQDGSLRLEKPNVKKMLARCSYRHLYKIRLGKYRLFFLAEEGDYKLLHAFRKSSNATPEKEVKQVVREIKAGTYIEWTD